MRGSIRSDVLGWICLAVLLLAGVGVATLVSNFRRERDRTNREDILGTTSAPQPTREEMAAAGLPPEGEAVTVEQHKKR